MSVRPPFPNFVTAVWLTVLASMTALLVMVLLSGGGEISVFGLACGLVAGFGGIGTLAARQVPPPQAERLGLRGMPVRFLLPVLLLVPLTLLASEVDNVVTAWVPPPDAAQIAELTKERIVGSGALDRIEGLILGAGVAPVIEEWFFRGVVQQGLVAQLGAPAGVCLTALLFALGHGSPSISLAAWLSAASGAFLYGLAFGLVRHASGSLLPSILLHAAGNALGAIALWMPERFPIAGYNAPGAHTPAEFLVPATVSVALGVLLTLRFDAPPIAADPGPPPKPDERS